jgi:hypothetical protein
MNKKTGRFSETGRFWLKNSRKTHATLAFFSRLPEPFLSKIGPVIECLVCHSAEPAGAIFCSQCSGIMPLSSWAIEVELPLLNDWPDPAGPQKLAYPSLIGQNLHNETQVKQLRFVIGDHGRTVTLSLDDPILIGRTDPERGIYPKLDLSCEDACECGVSRRHALIEVTDADIVLTDLGSTNGTLLNTFPLPPDLPYSLHNGDRIHIGKLLIQVYFH